MTIEELRVKVRAWDSHIDPNLDEHDPRRQIADARYSYILNQLEHHAVREWKVYLPAEHPDSNASYLDRLAQWIGNAATEDDQKLLLEYASYISFFSHEDFMSLYTTAFNREIMRWVAQQVGCRLEGIGLKQFDEEVRWHVHHQTWFCPVTDSMDINEFFKVNHLTGVGHRPCFSILQHLAEDSGPKNPVLAQNVNHYMQFPRGVHSTHPPLERLVLLEDIVGSGSQCINAVRWAVQNIGKPILFVPLILCPNGVEQLRTEERNSNGLLTVRPIVKLDRSDLLGPERQNISGWRIADQIEDFATRSSQGALAGLDPFGYRSTGCSLATFTNTPDNTLPIVHHKPDNGNWDPLFPRVFRD
jgi:hypothetical protein